MRVRRTWLGIVALALGAGGIAVACGGSDVNNVACDPNSDPSCATGDGGLPPLPDGASWPDGTVVLPDGAIELPDGEVVLPDGAVTTDSAPPPDGTPTDTGPSCKPYGELCTSGSTCCSGVCDTGGHCTSTIGPGACKANLQPCSSSTDCCSLSCIGGACSATACTSDGQSCSSNAQCCSGTCNGGTCQALNTTCKTAGNSCGANGDCCSKLCTGGKCQLGASYCTQLGDVCSRGIDCCTGVCNIASGKTLGTCAANAPGSTYCSAGVDGTVCNGDCGECCSRLCAPYGPSGVKICQPANGCHVNGDLCRKDSDCCGGAGSGEPGDGHVSCIFMPGQTIGICRNPNACNPEGDVCHYLQDTMYQCSSSSTRNDCCAALGANSDCKLDSLGIPRCNGGGACHTAGQACAYSGDCCSGLPCVPNPSGSTPPFVCGATTCQPAGATCTIDGDCCSGLTCNKPIGSASGTCGNPTPPPPPPPDGGTDGSTTTDSGTTTDGSTTTDSGTTDTAPACSLYGQSCTTAADCCNAVDCLTATGVICTGTQTGCTCHFIIQ